MDSFRRLENGRTRERRLLESRPHAVAPRSEPAAILALQRSAGNHATAQFLAREIHRERPDVGYDPPSHSWYRITAAAHVIGRSEPSSARFFEAGDIHQARVSIKAGDTAVVRFSIRLEVFVDNYVRHTPFDNQMPIPPELPDPIQALRRGGTAPPTTQVGEQTLTAEWRVRATPQGTLEWLGRPIRAMGGVPVGLPLVATDLDVGDGESDRVAATVILGQPGQTYARSVPQVGMAAREDSMPGAPIRHPHVAEITVRNVQPEAQPPTGPIRRLVERDIHFRQGDDDLDNNEGPQLDSFWEQLSPTTRSEIAEGRAQVRLVGRASSEGDWEANMRLSERRIGRVESILRARARRTGTGAGDLRFATDPRGEQDSAHRLGRDAPRSREPERREDRRVTVTLWDTWEEDPTPGGPELPAPTLDAAADGGH